MARTFGRTLVFLGLAAVGVPAGAAGIGGSVHSASLTIALDQYLWPKIDGVATVPYLIDANSDPNATPKIDAAIAIFNADFAGVIQWVPWTSSMGPDYVDIDLSASDTSGVCEAEEGYEAMAAQPMGGSTDCSVGTILHEMGHVIGLWHEQSRPDRASYVDVTYANVVKGSWGNFLSQPQDEQILGAYDYASVMEYTPYAFTRDGAPVIETIPAGMPLAGFEGVPAQAGASGNPSLPNFDYSAGDKEAILRLYGAAPKSVTVTSNPVGLSVTVDGVTVTTPQTYAWPLYSTHTLDVPAGVQSLAGYILYSNPAVAATFYYTYGRWSDSTQQSHSITATPGNGSPVFPTDAPQVATYSANFIQLVPYAASVWPSGSGTVSVSPQPQSYAGAPGLLFFVARQQATLTAAAASGWSFYSFNNGPFWLPGGLGANPKSLYVPDSGNPVDTTVYFSDTPVYAVDVAPGGFSANLSATVDSGFVYTPRNFSPSYDSGWTAGSTHTLAVDALQYPSSANSRYGFSKWSDGGAITHSITLPATSAKYTATVVPQYRPATNFSYPPCGGGATIAPASPTGDGFYPTGQLLALTATADAGWTFAGWTYDVLGSANPANLTADGETLVDANFNTMAAVLMLTGTKPASATAGEAGFELTIEGTGFTPASLVYANGSYRSATYASANILKVPLTSADLASPGAFSVFVENFPSGWNGCAVFAYATFIVEGKGPPVAEPVFSPKGGTYSSAQTVTITDAVQGATIYYTTDGSTPTKTSPQYSGPITVSGTETLKADAYATGYVRSAVAAAAYTIK